jgi:vitamin B12 transporter
LNKTVFSGFLVCCVLLHSGFKTPLYAEDSVETGEDAFAEDSFPIMEDELGLTVTGTAETTQQMQIVSRAEIERSLAQDVAFLLQETLGLSITRYGGYGSEASVSLRGFDSARVAFLINGVPASSAKSGEFDLSRIDPASIERIEVIYGGSDVKYNVSGALGGVINIVTVKNRTKGLTLGAGVSNVSSLPGKYTSQNGLIQNPEWKDLASGQKADFNAGWGGENSSFSAQAFAIRDANNFLYTDYMKKTRRKSGAEVKAAGGSASFLRNLAGLSKLVMSIDVFFDGKNIPVNGYSANSGSQRDFSSRQTVLFSSPRIFEKPLSAGVFSVEASLSHNLETMDFKPYSGTASFYVEQNVNASNRWRWDAKTGILGVFTGWDCNYARIEDTDSSTGQDLANGGLYAGAEIRIAKQFLVVPSVKGVFSRAGSFSAVAAPKLGLAWFVTPELTLKNNYFRSFKHPSFNDLYWPEQADAAGDPNLKPEDGWGADAVAEFRRGIFGAKAAVFAQYTKDSIHWAPSPDGVWRPSNEGEAAFFGLDADFSVDFSLKNKIFKKITASAGYEGMASYLLSYGYDFKDEKRIPYMPANKLTAAAAFFWESGSLSFSAVWEGLRYSSVSNSPSSLLKPVLLANINATQQINQNLWFSGKISNLFNTSYESFAGYPMPGFTLTLAVRMNLEPSKTGKAP